VRVLSDSAEVRRGAESADRGRAQGLECCVRSSCGYSGSRSRPMRSRRRTAQGPSIRHHDRQHAWRDMVPMQQHDNSLDHRRADTNWNVRHLRKISRQSAQSATCNKRIGCGRQPRGETCRPENASGVGVSRLCLLATISLAVAIERLFDVRIPPWVENGHQTGMNVDGVVREREWNQAR
jgi:hypothetical protein